MVLCDPTPVERLQSRRLVSVPAGGRRWPEGRITKLQLDAEAMVFGGGRLRLRVDVAGNAESRLWVRLAGQRFELSIGNGRADSELDLPEVQWWWPRGYGAQTRYPVLVSLVTPDGRVVDAEHRQVGFRWVQWAEPQDTGEPGLLVVNGVPVRVRGLTWTAGGAEPAHNRLDRIAAANANLVRVAGYQEDDFYDRCDELGLLTWQDLGARAPDELRPALPDLTRIAHHPSLVLLSGAETPEEHLLADLAPQVPYRSACPVRTSPAPPNAPRLAAGDLRTDLTRQRCDPRWWGGVLVDGPDAPDQEFYELVGAAYADRMLALRPIADGLVATVVNDTAARLTGRLRFRRLSADGTVIAASDVDVEVAARRNGVIRVPERLLTPAREPGGFVRAELGGLRDQYALDPVAAISRG